MTSIDSLLPTPPNRSPRPTRSRSTIARHHGQVVAGVHGDAVRTGQWTAPPSTTPILEFRTGEPGTDPAWQTVTRPATLAELRVWCWVMRRFGGIAECRRRPQAPTLEMTSS